MELSNIPGVGAKKAQRLNEVGINTAEDLASFDLRTLREDLPGWTRDGLRKAKQDARRVLAKQGVSFEKAPYGDGKANRKAPRRAAAESAPVPAARPAAKKARAPFWKRVLGKA